MAVTQQRTDLVLDLFDKYYDRVYAFLRKSATPDVGEDLAQEVFLRLLQHPELERLEISISYLLKIAHNLLRRRYARASRLRELLEERVHREGMTGFEPGQRPSLTPEPLSNNILEAALGLLSCDEQDSIRLIVCEGKSYQHAAEALGVSVTTINNWKHRGIIKLRKLIDEEGDLVVAGGIAEEASAPRERVRSHRIETASDFASDYSSSRIPSFERRRAIPAWRTSADDAA